MKKSLLFGISLAVNITATACSCIYEGSFLKMAKHTPLNGLFKVTKFLTFKSIEGKSIPMSMEVKMIDKYKGKESRKRLVVWGDPGNLCRPYLSVFTEEQYYVIALSSVGKKTPEEKDADYFINNCGAYWLNVNSDRSNVTGDIDSNNKTIKTMIVRKLKSELKKLNSSNADERIATQR